MKHLRLVIETNVHEGNSRPWVSQGLSHTENFIMPLDKGFPPPSYLAYRSKLQINFTVPLANKSYLQNSIFLCNLT